MDPRSALEGERIPRQDGREIEDRRQAVREEARQTDRYEDRYEDRRDDDDRRYDDVDWDRVEDRRDDRRDYYHDRDDFERGATYTAIWWTSHSCVSTEVVEVDGYTYYQCNGAWFSRTYYGGEVTYTVTDAPRGY